MRVLVVCPFVPWPLDSGGRIRTFHLVRHTAKHAEVHLRFVTEPGAPADAVEQLAPHCASVRAFARGTPGPWLRWTRPKLERWFHSPSLAAALREESSGYDLVHLDEMFLARVPDPSNRVPTLVHHHKLDTVLYELAPLASGVRRDFDLWKLRKLEREAARRFRHHVLCSVEDAADLASRHPGLECSVVPSGFDEETMCSGDSPAREPDTLVYVGTMSYAPNVDAMRYFVSEVFPRVLEQRPAARLRIVGRDPVPSVAGLASERVEVVGTVDDVRPFLERAALVVVPLRIGGGSRVKIVEALSMECAVVSTTIGAQGLSLSDGEHLVLADSPDELAASVVDLLADPERARSLGRAGRIKVCERYTWTRLADDLLAAWRRAAEAP